jgi:putative acyl-CoA dehydrogenase
MSPPHSNPDDGANQSPPFVDVDLYSSDRPVQEAVAVNGGDQPSSMSEFGRRWGSADMAELARQANRNPPTLCAGEAGARIVAFDGAYYQLMTESIAAGLHASTWTADGTRAGAPAEVARAERFYIAAQVETGHLCPITMTRAAVAALAAEPELAARFVPKIVARAYEPEFRPWWEKPGITLGMGMTEKQGGTDVRTNTTRATPAGEAYAITGHKWFMSAPMSDAFLVLAQATAGLTCFLMPRFRPDGGVNGLHFQKLKDKLGNRSNASSEVEFTEAFAWRVGEEGKGIRTILQMVQLTRLDCAIASAGIMRMALAQALHHARHRSVFQRRLIEQPMMRTVLADMALTVEGAVALVMRLARAFDRAPANAHEAVRARLLTPAVKYWVCKAAPALIYEAMECLGGNGYVEDSILPRLYREAPVNAIWEGSGNVMCLDVLRAFARERGEAHDVLSALGRESGDLPGAADALRTIADVLVRAEAEAHARAIVEGLAMLAATAALAASAPRVAAIFARSRLVDPGGATYGTRALEPGETTLLLERALPAS